MKKATIQDIAASLGVSRTTVWKVFSNRGGVSPTLSSQIMEKAREMNYVVPGTESSAEHSTILESSINIAVAVCRPETSVFWMSIIHRVAQELARHNVNLVYTYLPYQFSEAYELPAVLTNGSINGIIIMNIYNDALIRLLAATDIPKVFLDTSTSIQPSSLNGDLMMMESRSCMLEITEHLISQGRKEIGFIGDIQYARSNYERYQGFVDAMMLYKKEIDPQFMLTGSMGVDTYAEEIGAYLDSLSHMPDAFVCVNDYVGGILIHALLHRGIRIPEDIAITGFDDNAENPLTSTLTTVRVFNQDIGRRLAQQILYRIDHMDTRYEVTYISSQVILRKSTEG